MRMPAAQARAITRRTKTQVRVPVDTRLTARPLRPARRHGGRPFNPTTGDLLTFYGGHHDTTGKWVTTDTVHAKLTAAIRAPLGTLTQQEAEAEGFPTVPEFEIDWVERHDSEWLERQISYLIENDIDPDEAEETRPGWARSRYTTRWAGRDTWHLTIEAFHDLPYLLPGLPEEPEAIPADKIHMRWGVKSARRYQAARDHELRTRDAKQLGRRVKLMKLHSPDAPEIAVIEAQLAALEARYSQVA